MYHMTTCWNCIWRRTRKTVRINTPRLFFYGCQMNLTLILHQSHQSLRLSKLGGKRTRTKGNVIKRQRSMAAGVPLKTSIITKITVNCSWLRPTSSLKVFLRDSFRSTRGAAARRPVKQQSPYFINNTVPRDTICTKIFLHTHTHVCSAAKHLSFDVTSTNIASFPFSHIFLALSSFSPCMLLTHPLSLYLRLSLGLGDYSAGCCPADKAEKNLPPSYISPSAANGCVLRVQEGWKKEEPRGNVPTDAQPSSLFTKSWVVNEIHCRLASHGHEMNRPACVFMLDYCSHRSKRKELSLCECDIMNLLKSDFLFFYILCSVCVYSPGLIQCVLLQQKMPRTSWS